MKLHIKNMVSLRCKLMVKQELKKLEMLYNTVDLGLIELKGAISEYQHQQLKTNLLVLGLEVLGDKRDILVERIVNVVNEIIQYDDLHRGNYSDIISEKLDYDYTYLSKVFSQMKGITLQQFIITKKVDRVKELLLYKELNLTEISYKLHYSSVGHLSNQFKKVTGISPSAFEQQNRKRKLNLENTGYV